MSSLDNFRLSPQAMKLPHALINMEVSEVPRLKFQILTDIGKELNLGGVVQLELQLPILFGHTPFD